MKRFAQFFNRSCFPIGCLHYFAMDGFMNILMYASNESLYIGEVHLYATVVSALLLAHFVRTVLSEWRFVPFSSPSGYQPLPRANALFERRSSWCPTLPFGCRIAPFSHVHLLSLDSVVVPLFVCFCFPFSVVSVFDDVVVVHVYWLMIECWVWLLLEGHHPCTRNRLASKLLRSNPLVQ